MYAAETTGEIAIKRSMPMSEPMAEESVRTRIEELVALHNGEIYAYLLRMVRDGELANQDHIRQLASGVGVHVPSIR